jgi:hypothetical protein
MKDNNNFKQHFREGQIGIKTFYELNKEEKNEYLQSLLALPEASRTTVDEHIIKFHNVLPVVTSKHWLSLD